MALVPARKLRQPHLKLQRKLQHHLHHLQLSVGVGDFMKINLDTLAFTVLTAFVFLWGLPQFKNPVKTLVPAVAIPGLHERIARQPPVVERREVEKAEYDVNPLAATGTGIFLAAVVSALWLRVGVRTTSDIAERGSADSRFMVWSSPPSCICCRAERSSGVLKALP